MAKNININRGVNDPYYRYKMPRIMAKVEGKGNGIKTVIANMTDIAKALARPPTYPTKYFGCELGAQTNFDLKNERYIVNGEHDANKLQDILDGFIKKFVLCPECDNPETILTVKRQNIHSKCKACGHAFLIDPKHKLSTFILKNPPPVESNEPQQKEKRDSGSPVNGENGGGNSDEFDEQPDSNEKDDDDWAPEPLTEAEKLSAQIGKLVVDKDLDKTIEERLDMLHQYFINAKEDGSIYNYRAMVNEAERLELKTKAPLLLADVLFDADLVNQLKNKSNQQLLIRFCANDKKAQRLLLGGIEQVVYNNRDVLVPKMAHIVKALYDYDLCEEETLLAWGEKPTSKYVKKDFSRELIKVALPVLNWLKEAEEDSESDEDDVAVVFDDRSQYMETVITEKKGSPAHTNGENVSEKKEALIQDDNGEEIDIDDI